MVSARHFDFYASCMAALVAATVGVLIWKDISFLDLGRGDVLAQGKPIASISASRNVVRKKTGSLPLWSVAGTEETLHANDYVFTDRDSSATLTFVDREQIELGQNTMIQVQRFQNEPRLDLLKGTLRAEGGREGKPLVIHLDKKGTVLRATAGSRVNVRADGSGKTDVTVLQGQAEIVQDQNRLTLAAAESATATDEGAVAKAKGSAVILASPLHDAEFALRAGEELAFSWTKPTSRESVWFELATREDFSELVVQEETSAASKTIKSLVPGTYYWRVRGEGLGEERRFTIALLAPPDLLWPENGLALDKTALVLVWKSVGKDHRYAVEIASQPDFATPLVKGMSEQTTFATPELSPGKYYWRVKDVDQEGSEWSTAGYFSIGALEKSSAEPETSQEDLLPPPDLNDQYEIEVPKEKDGAFLWEQILGMGTAYAAEGDFPVIRWPAIKGARAYAIQIATSEAFEKILREEDVPAPLFSFEGFQPGTYYLRIATRNARGVKGAFSKPVKVVISMPSPRLVAPSNGASLSSEEGIAFDWRRVEGASAYVVEIARDAAFKSIVRTERPPLSSTEIKGLEPGTYYWRVSAVFKSGESGKPSRAARLTLVAPAPTAPVPLAAPEPPPPATVPEQQTAPQVVATLPAPSAPRPKWSFVAGAAPTRFHFEGGDGKPDLSIHATLYNSFYADASWAVHERWDLRLFARRLATELFSADDAPPPGQQPVKIAPMTVSATAALRLSENEKGMAGVRFGVVRQTLLNFSEDAARSVSVEHAALFEPFFGIAGEVSLLPQWRLGGGIDFAMAPKSAAAHVEKGSHLMLDVTLTQILSLTRTFAQYGYRMERARYTMAVGGKELKSAGDALTFGLGFKF